MTSTQPIESITAVEHIYVHFISSAGHRLIEVREVVEIIPMVLLDQSGSSLADGGLVGLFNYRGKIIPAFDIGTEKSKTVSKKINVTADQFLIVSRMDNKSLAIVATEVNQLVSVLASDISHIDPLGEKSFSVAKVNNLMIRIVRGGDFMGATTA